MFLCRIVSLSSVLLPSNLFIIRKYCIEDKRLNLLEYSRIILKTQFLLVHYEETNRQIHTEHAQFNLVKFEPAEIQSVGLSAFPREFSVHSPTANEAYKSKIGNFREYETSIC